MADARSTQSILDAAGAPVTAAPSVVHVDRAGGARTPPTTTHLGGGKHGFSVSNVDEALGTIVLMDFGAGAEPRYQVFACHLADGSNQFFAWVLTDEAGALWTAPTPDPTVGLYDDPTGAPRTPPAPVPAVGRHLWSLTPSSADVAVGVELRVDSPPGALPVFLDGSTVPVVSTGSPWEAPSPGPIRNPAYDVAQFLTTKTVGGVVLTVGTNLFISRMPDTDRSPSPAVACLNTGGEAPAPYLDDSRRSYFSASVQVLVRSAVDDFEAGERVARGIIEWCHQRVAVGYVTWLSRDSQPGYLGPDANHRHTWAINLDAEYAAELG